MVRQNKDSIPSSIAAADQQFDHRSANDFYDKSLEHTRRAYRRIVNEFAAGTSYVFEGRFLRKGDFSKLPDNIPVLEGILIKKVNDMEQAKENLKFEYFDPDN